MANALRRGISFNRRDLRRERDVLEAGESGESGPLFRLVALRVEGAGQDVKETIERYGVPP